MSTYDYPPTPSRQLTHVVREGDSLFTIAKLYYGNGHEWPRIRNANLENGSIDTGDVLVIPQ